VSRAENRAVFLSYASQDAEAARRIAEALRAAGVEVWFDQNELRGGDAWDAKIRKQIKECALFVPVISPNTNTRAEGYFRLEWKLAVDRSHLMADDAPFLFPIAIDDVTDATARVPDKFREVQWTRLRLDETPAELAGRVARLLSGEAVAGLGEAGPGSSTPATTRRKAGFGDPALQRKKTGFAKWWWLVFPLFGMTMALVTVLKRNEGSGGRVSAVPPAVSPDPRSQVPDPKSSEARQLAERARALSLDKFNSTAADFATAEGLLQRALELDQNDAELWTISSLFNTSIRTRGFDHAPVRREQARRDAERAVTLAPDSVSALFALGRAQRDTDHAAAEATFRRILVLDPNHAEAMSQVAWICDLTDRLEEAITLYDRVLVLDPQSAPLTHYVRHLLFFHYGRFAEAEAEARKSVALEPSANGVTGEAIVALTWRGDAAAAARALAAAPTAVQRSPRMIWVGALVHLARRDPEETLRTLQRTEDVYLQDNWFAGPKAMFAGLAHRQAGRPEAARVAWEAALTSVDERLKAAPQNEDLHLARGQLLAWLGREEEARREARTLLEINSGRPEGVWVYSPALIHAALGDAALAVPALARLLEWDQNRNNGWPLTPALLRADVRWDPIRSDPGFEEMVAKAEAAQLAALPPRDWPRDPELKKAFAIVTGTDVTAESCRLAEEMIEAVLKRRPADTEATVVYAMLNNYYLNRGFDSSEDRFVLARRYAERAMQLAPEEPEAIAAMAQFLSFRGADFARAEELIRKSMALAPREPRFARILSYNILRLTRLDEAMAQAKENTRRFPDNPLIHYDLSLISRAAGDIVTMEQALDRSIELEPIGSALIWKGWLAAWMHGDLPGFKSWLDRITGNFRYNERAVYMRYLYACLSGDANYGLDAVRSYTGGWMSDFYYTGPRTLLLGDLLVLQGKAEAAREEYDRAIAEVRRMVAANPDDDIGWRAEFWALFNSGRREEARLAARRMMERINRPYRPIMMLWWHDPIAAQLLAGERADALTLIREAAASPAVRAQIRTALSIDGRMAPFRDDPEIRTILDGPEGR